MSGNFPILTLSLNTFIRYYSIDHSKMIGEVSRRMQQSGGYDFYRLLNEAIKAKIRGATDDETRFILGGTSNPSEESYNKAAFDMFMSKYGKKRGLTDFDKKGRVKLCDGELVILVSPQFAIEAASGFSVFNVWAAQNPELDRTRASVGVYLMQQAFRKTAPNYDYKMFNAVDGKTYSAINNTIPQAIQNVAQTVVNLGAVDVHLV
jgi:hypothetical protein